MEASRATIAQRSYSGCRTCRQRKVKCDEIRDDIGRCGPCSRLKRKCDWTREWKFIDTNHAVERQYVVLGSSPEGNFTELATTKLESGSKVSTSSHSHATISTNMYPPRSKSTTTLNQNRPVMFVNSFSNDLAATERCGDRRLSKQASSRASDSSSSEDDDSRSAHSVELIRSVRIPYDLMNYGTRARDNDIHPLLFDTIICRKIMPMAVRFKLNIEDNQNVLISSAKNFLPLRHAICAITLLNSGLKNRPELIAGSFQHYDTAITACRSMSSSASPEVVFFFHFILLMYDIACASQRWPEDRASWALHLCKLASLAHEPAGPTVSRLKAYLSWYILLLDSQAGLAGNPEAGHFSRAFLENGRSLPAWPISPSQQKVLSAPESMKTFLQMHKLSLITFEMYAEQSQASLSLRRELRDHQISLNERQQRIQNLSIQHATTWQVNCPTHLDSQEDESVPSPDRVIITSTYNFARLQYSVLQVHLHTSMYPHQRLDGDVFAAEDAQHCTYIIDTVRQSFALNDRENHHLAHALFLAGAATRIPAEKAEALMMLQEMEQAGISGAVARVRHVLELVVREQAKREVGGGSADEVDWIELSQGHGFKNVVFGM